jgi:SepF-like predicted cell division protein (DUF552 family)
MKFIEMILRKAEKVPVEEYEELDLSEYEAEISSEATTYIRIVEVAGIGEVAEIRKQIYEGNIVIADIAYIKHDKLTYERILKDLRQLAEDVNGDIVGFSEDYIIITPTGIKVDRNKIRGAR